MLLQHFCGIDKYSSEISKEFNENKAYFNYLKKFGNFFWATWYKAIWKIKADLITQLFFRVFKQKVCSDMKHSNYSKKKLSLSQDAIWSFLVNAYSWTSFFTFNLCDGHYDQLVKSMTLLNHSKWKWKPNSWVHCHLLFSFCLFVE